MATTQAKAQNDIDLSGTEYSAVERAHLRAQMEEMTVEIIGDDLAEVCNLSYPADERFDHTYMVEIDLDASPKGEPVGCSCPGYSLGGAYCKHMAAVKRVLLGLDTADADYRTDGHADEPADADADDEDEDEDAIERAVEAGADELLRDPDEIDGELITDGEGGCPHDHPDCDGVDSPRDRPELCCACWDEWAAYDPDDYLLPDDERPGEDEVKRAVEATADDD